MPTYEYVCKNCRHELEELQTMSEPPLLKCPACGQETLARIMGGGGGLIFKGSGFYLTDYAKAEGKKPATKPEQKTETKPESTAPPASDPPETKNKSTESKKDPPPSSESKKE